MFSRKRILDRPLVQTRSDYKGVPDDFNKMFSTQFWFYIENDCFEKIVAIRTYGYQDFIAFKVKFYNHQKYTSILLKEPELRILKRLWECGHDGINVALKEYITYSPSCFQQWVRQTAQNTGCFEWYLDTNMGKKNG